LAGHRWRQPELSPKPTTQLQDCAAAAAHSVTPSEAHDVDDALRFVTQDEAIPSLHDHGVKDALGVVAMARQHVWNKGYQVGAVVRQHLGDMLVAGLGNRVPGVLIPGDGRPDVPYENLVDMCGQGAGP